MGAIVIQLLQTFEHESVGGGPEWLYEWKTLCWVCDRRVRRNYCSPTGRPLHTHPGP